MKSVYKFLAGDSIHIPMRVWDCWELHSLCRFGKETVAVLTKDQKAVTIAKVLVSG